MSQPAPTPSRRSSLVIAACAAGLALVGFATGVTPVEHVDPLPPAPPAPAGGEVLPGRSYTQLRERRLGSGSRLTSDPAQLREGIPAPTEPLERTEAMRLAAVAARAERRAFDGAPPSVPHSADELSSQACLSCHRAGMAVAGKIARVMSHPELGNCLQCHALSFERPGVAWDKAQTDFVGRLSAGHGERAWPGAPPAMPHSSWMREDCSSCHGVAGAPGLRTPHPMRQSCPQCHALRAGLDLPGMTSP